MVNEKLDESFGGESDVIVNELVSDIGYSHTILSGAWISHNCFDMFAIMVEAISLILRIID